MVALIACAEPQVALLTELLVQLGSTKPELRRTVTVVFICNEENGVVEGIGVDKVRPVEVRSSRGVRLTGSS
jgi:hypothetical protein